ncbi:MAG: hypothetical protein ACTSRK_03230 [Promethearchaeota archaeon]
MEEIQNEMIQLGVYALIVRGEGQDLLMGKNVHEYIEIQGLEALLRKFILDLDKFFEDIYNNDIPSYLKRIEKRFKLDLSFLAENLVGNIEQMRSSDSDDIMIFYLVITKTLEHIRQMVFHKYGWAEINKHYESLNQKSLTTDQIERVSDSDDEGDPDLSLFYNLNFIKFLAEIYEDKVILQKSKKIIKNTLEHFFESF